MPPAADDPDRIDRIRLCEQLRSVASAVQARETAAFARSQRAEQPAAAAATERAGRGVVAQVALARRISPYQAQRYVGWSRILTEELPATFAALAGGRVSEWRAMIVARETAWLAKEHRLQVDAAIAPRLEQLGDRKLEAEVKTLGYRLDPHGYVGRIRGAESDRRVGLRPAPDAMCRLSALLPVAQGVAAYATLARAADRLRGAGDRRGRGQLMADTLVERITGQAEALDVPVEVNLVMTDTALVDGDSREPAVLLGYGPIPSEVARGLVRRPGDQVPRWLRRLYTRPDAGDLVSMDSRRRLFTPAQRHFLLLRDQVCRTPWCDAPIRHVDHVVPAEEGGPTNLANGQGLCESCNYVKQAQGWRTVPVATDTVEIRTPTGHRYRHSPPRLPRPLGRAGPRSRVELNLARRIAVLVEAA